MAKLELSKYVCVWHIYSIRCAARIGGIQFIFPDYNWPVVELPLPHIIIFDMSKQTKTSIKRIFVFENEIKKKLREYFSIFVCRWSLTFINHMLQWLFIKFIFHSPGLGLLLVACVLRVQLLIFKWTEVFLFIELFIEHVSKKEI